MEKRYGSHWNGIKTLCLEVVEGKYKHHFGGMSFEFLKCPICSNQVQQFINLDLSDPQLNELNTGLKNLSLVGCLNCSLNWEEQFYMIQPKENKITYIGLKNSFNFIQEKEDQIISPLPSFKCSLRTLSSENLPTDEDKYWSSFNNAGNEYFCRILGSPLFAQEYIEKHCPCCEKKMKYIVTLVGSDYGNTKLIPNFEFYMGDFYLYYFLCENCLIVATDNQPL